MERFLLWLDDLDDLAAIWAHHLGRIRRRSLQAGLVAACALPLADAAAFAGRYVNGLAALAAFALLVWTAALAAEHVSRRSTDRRQRTA